MHLGLACEIPILRYGSTMLTYKFYKILYSLIQILVICLRSVYANILYTSRSIFVYTVLCISVSRTWTHNANLELSKT